VGAVLVTEEHLGTHLNPLPAVHRCRPSWKRDRLDRCHVLAKGGEAATRCRRENELFDRRGCSSVVTVQLGRTLALAHSCGPIWREWPPETLAVSRRAGGGFCRSSNKRRQLCTSIRGEATVGTGAVPPPGHRVRTRRHCRASGLAITSQISRGVTTRLTSCSE
jgi:hypothetical protein